MVCCMRSAISGVSSQNPAFVATTMSAWRRVFYAFILLGLANHCYGGCTWYGICGHQPNNENAFLNCPYSGPPKPFQTDDAKELFSSLCPDLYTGPDVETCCDATQLETLAKQIAIPREALQRCPSCHHNFLHLWCHFTCSPNQDDFMTINKTSQFRQPDGNVTDVVTGVNYYLTEDSTNALFNSCRNVQNPSTNTPALSILCGTTAEKCTPQGWLDFMGTTNNGQAPFDVWFYVSSSNITVNGTSLRPLNYRTVTCNQAPSDKSQACSCQDCAASCVPTPPRKPKPGRCKVSQMDCFDFGFTVGFAVFALVFGGYTIITLSSLHKSCSDDLSPYATDKTPHDADSSRDKKPKCCNSIGVKMEVFTEKMFFKWGFLCARHPFITMFVVLVLSGGLCAGLALFTVTTDPVKLWSSPTSRARREKEYFDSHFVPFYRIQQLVISRPHNATWIEYKNRNYTNLFDKDFLHKVLDLQDAITTITAVHNDKNISLPDICFAPLRPDNNNCTIQSVLNYYQNSHEMLDKEAMDEFGWWVLANYLDHFEYCVLSPFSINDTTELHSPCLGTYGGPVFPWIALGGFTDKKYRTSRALVITLLVNNHLDQSLNEPVKAWEHKFVEFMQNYISTHPDVQIAFSSERSIEDELDRQSQSDIITILASYLIMFGYVSLCLGQYMNPSRILVDAKLSLGLSGVILVLLSVGASLGFYSYVGVPSTLIIIEVVPFLVLAVGVDNIFILVQKYQRHTRDDDHSVEHKIGQVLGQVGPSMLLTSTSESVAFFLGALTDMPAVKTFSLYAAMAVLLNFLLQISIFVALFTLDAKRQEANRMDVLCCAQLPLEKRRPHRGILYVVFSDYYSHFLLHPWVRPFVMLVFVGWLCANAALTSRLNIGLDQSLAMPKDSYLLNYFGNLSEYLSVGAPVYFVVEDGLDYSTYTGQNDICGVSGCPDDSLVQQINVAAQAWKSTYIAEPVTSWLDDYFAWISSPTCCRYDTQTLGFCPSTETKSTCAACPTDQMEMGRPVNHTFNKYLSWYLSDNPGIKCSKGGHAAYGTGVQLYRGSHNESRVGASYFMTYHTILKTSEDYIEALRSSREISDNITRSLHGTGLRVFPYSVFYVFYEQYLDLVDTAFVNIAYCLAAILVITFVMLGFDLHSALIVVGTIVMIVVNITGLMYLWGVELNALSLVNLIMATGISVEFCSHTVRGFSVSRKSSRTERARESLSEMGSSVLSGISLTKVAGIIMLAMAKSQLFQVFYFRMYLAIVVFGAAHGLIFLPVLLSYLGPPVRELETPTSRASSNGETTTITDQKQLPDSINSKPIKKPPSYEAVTKHEQK